MADRLERAAKAIASGCYDELVDKSDMSRDAYVDQYWPLFKRAAERVMEELEVA